MQTQIHYGNIKGTVRNETIRYASLKKKENLKNEIKCTKDIEQLEIELSNSDDSELHDRIKVSKGAKIRSRYNQVPHPTQDTNGKVTNSQLDTTSESQEVSPFPAGDHKAQINRRAQRHSKHKTEQKHKRSTKEVPPWERSV